MAIELQQPWKDTPITGATSATLSLPVINYQVDWGVQTNNGKEAFITNSTAMFGAEQRFKFARSDVNNVYTGSGIEPNLMATTRRGTSIVCQLTSVFDIIDPEVPAFKQQLPMSCHVVIKVPNNELITADVVKDYLCRTLAGLFEPGSSDASRLALMLRGSLVPTEM